MTYPYHPPLHYLHMLLLLLVDSYYIILLVDWYTILILYILSFIFLLRFYLHILDFRIGNNIIHTYYRPTQ